MNFPVLKGPSLGQKPPGLIPKIFTPGIVSTENHEHSSLIISSDGKYLFFSRPNGEKNGDIYWVSTKIIEKLKPEELK